MDIVLNKAGAIKSGYDETEAWWHLLTVTRGGNISILKNLDAPTARQAYQRLMPDSRPVEYINMPKEGYCGTYCYTLPDSHIKRVHILGPEGCDLDPWRGVETLVIDLAAESDALASDIFRA